MACCACLRKMQVYKHLQYRRYQCPMDKQSLTERVYLLLCLFAWPLLCTRTTTSMYLDGGLASRPWPQPAFRTLATPCSLAKMRKDL